jgi:hypothetical protein
VTLKDLHSSGHVLWELSGLKRAKSEVAAARRMMTQRVGAFSAVEHALLEAGDGHYWSEAFADESFVGGKVGVRIWCYFRRDRRAPAKIGFGEYTRPVTGTSPQQSSALLENAAEEVFLGYLRQLRYGLAHFYRSRMKPARSRQELAELLGRESKGWGIPGVAHALERVISGATYALETKKPHPTAK